MLPEGIYDAHNTPVDASCLYLAQLEERVGKAGSQIPGIRFDLRSQQGKLFISLKKS